MLESSVSAEPLHRRGHLGFSIPYTHEGRSHQYVPDFLVRLRSGDETARTLIVEVSGGRNDQAAVTPRVDSVTARLLDALPELPVVTAGTVERHFGVSFQAARRGHDELADADILNRRKIERGTTAYLAGDIFELLTFAERRLASPEWDTNVADAVRPVPARPQP